MPSKHVEDDENPLKDAAAPTPTGSGSDAGASAAAPLQPENSDGATAPPDGVPWTEPRVSSQAIFRELFQVGTQSEEELRQLLSRYSTDMGWADYWSREGFLTEVVTGSEKRIALSRKAVVELELF